MSASLNDACMAGNVEEVLMRLNMGEDVNQVSHLIKTTFKRSNHFFLATIKSCHLGKWKFLIDFTNSYVIFWLLNAIIQLKTNNNPEVVGAKTTLADFIARSFMGFKNRSERGHRVCSQI